MFIPPIRVLHLLTVHFSGFDVLTHTNRESRYPMLLRRKNATRGSGADRKAEMASIGKSRGSLIDPRTEQSQVAIEAAISEGTQFDPHGGGMALPAHKGVRPDASPASLGRFVLTANISGN